MVIARKFENEGNPLYRKIFMQNSRETEFSTLLGCFGTLCGGYLLQRQVSDPHFLENLLLVCMREGDPRSLSGSCYATYGGTGASSNVTKN